MRQSQIEYNRRTLAHRIRLAREEVENARHALREEQLARDEFELRLRPSFPTAEMRLGIEDAVLAIKRGEEPKSSQGTKMRSGVAVHGTWGYVWVEHGAPYGQASNGYLWHFTEPEIQRMREQIESLGVKLDTDWNYAKGHTFVIALAK